jgi:putative addiction module component (TIGR02574 family)
MARNVAEITKEALELPESDQFRLARILLENTAVSGETDVDLAWEEEIERRIAEIHAGAAKGVPYAEVLEEFNRRFKKS